MSSACNHINSYSCSVSPNPEATTIPLLEKGKKIHFRTKHFKTKEGVFSVGELPAVGGLLADVFEDFGLLDFLGFLVAKATTASSLFKLAVVAIHV